MKVRTRFAPSPTGYLHIGGARTALFNYLYAKKHKGDFLLRIEDTDLVRSNTEAKKAILDSLDWLNLHFDHDVLYQSTRQTRYLEIANKLLNDGKAYYCFTPQDEIIKRKQEAIKKGKNFIFTSPWRNANTNTYPSNIPPVIRLKVPKNSKTVVKDLVQGNIVVLNSNIDDMILVRSDGTATYTLAVVVDDHDMKITHIIRGDDHLSNSPKQQLIYTAMQWDIPTMVHIPLIHGTDGHKLSKRHGSLGIESYKKMGYLPEAILNYLLRLGWSHGNDEIISMQQAIEWFDTNGLGKSSSRLDFKKMRNINAKYLRRYDSAILADMVFSHHHGKLSEKSQNIIKNAIECIKPRIELVTDLYELAQMFIVDYPIKIDKEARILIKECNHSLIIQVTNTIYQIQDFKKNKIQESLTKLAADNDLTLCHLMKYVRAYITGKTTSPSVFEMMEILGPVETISRLTKVYD